MTSSPPTGRTRTARTTRSPRSSTASRSTWPPAAGPTSRGPGPRSSARIWRGEDIIAAIDKVRQERAETVVIGSGTLVTSLMLAELIDEYKFLVQPIVAGHGKRVFRDDATVKIQLVAIQELDQSVLFLRYRRQ